jgi:hypothetical protein
VGKAVYLEFYLIKIKAMDILYFKHFLILVFLLGIIFYSVFILAGEFFVHGFKPLTFKAFGYSLILCLAHIVYYFINDDYVKPQFPNRVIYVKLIQFIILSLVYGIAIWIQWHRFKKRN